MVPRADDLLLLLVVARRRTYLAAGAELGVSHTTVARRLHQLERDMGGRLLIDSPSGWTLSPLGEAACSAARQIENALTLLGPATGEGPVLQGLVRISAPEAFMNHVVTRVVATVSREHPRIRFELLSATRPATAHSLGGDLDIGVSHPASPRLVSQRVADYSLALYASRDYLAAHDPVRTRSDLRRHLPIYYVESMLQVADLDVVHQFFPDRAGMLGATSVEAQLRLVESGAGVGILPAYVANKRPGLRRLLARDATHLTYWMVSRPENSRRPEVAAVAQRVLREAESVIGHPPARTPARG